MPESEDSGSYLRLPAQLAWRIDVSDGAKLLYARLRQPDGGAPHLEAKVAALAVALGKSRRRVEKYIAELVRLGLLQVELRRGQRRPSLYTLPDHRWLHEAAPSPANPRQRAGRRPPDPLPCSSTEAHVGSGVSRNVGNGPNQPAPCAENAVAAHVANGVTTPEPEVEVGADRPRARDEAVRRTLREVEGLLRGDWSTIQYQPL